MKLFTWVALALSEVRASDGSVYAKTISLASGDSDTLGLTLDSEQSWVITKAQGQAAEAGIGEGDRLHSINGRLTHTMKNNEIFHAFGARPLELGIRHAYGADKECFVETMELLYDHVRAARVRMLRTLLEEHRCDVSISLAERHPLIHEAAEIGRPGLLRVLAFYGANVDSEVAGSRPIHRAAKLGHSQALIVLKELGADIQAIDGAGLALTHLAAANGKIQVLKVAKMYGLPLFSIANGMTPLQMAIANGQEMAAEQLRKWDEAKKQRQEQMDAAERYEQFNALMGSEL